MKIVILAGGLGQRLWPVSRTQTPKHIKPLLGAKTLLQQTVRRLEREFKTSDILIVTGKDYKSAISSQLPKFPRQNLIIEPARKNTAAAIGLAAYTLAKKNPAEIMVSIASDHYIGQEKKFLKNLRQMGEAIRAKPVAVCLMGLKPVYPETGYGYIKTGERAKINHRLTILKIEKFIEKPSLLKAKKLIRSGNCYWNPSYFAWRVDRIIQLFSQHLPMLHKLLIQTLSGRPEAFKKISAPAIEYALLEKLKTDFFMIPADFPWADIGHWASVREIHATSTSGNVVLGLHHLLDTSGSLVYNYTSGVVTTIGVKDLLIIQTEDGTLVCRKDRAQDVKRLVEQMRHIRHLKKFV